LLKKKKKNAVVTAKIAAADAIANAVAAEQVKLS